MPTSKSFDQLYSETLQPLLADFEARRKELIRPMIWAIVSLLVGIILLVICFSNQENVSPVFYFLCFPFIIVAVVLYFKFNDKRRSYVDDFKETIVRKIVTYFDPSFKYVPDEGIGESDYTKSGLFLKKVDRYRGGDYVEGQKEKTFFCFCELHTEFEVKSDKQSSWETIFKGLFFIADFNKNFKGRTYVWSEYNPQLDFFKRTFSSFADGLQKVELESEDFESRFIVYSTDQVEARYILTPSLMERMGRVQDRLRKDIVFSFVQTNIYAAIPVDKDLFEPGIFQRTSDDMLMEYYHAIDSMLFIIDELNLNLRIWNKE